MTTMDRRDLLKAAWVAPLILTYAVTPSMARAGSQDVADGDESSSWTVTTYRDGEGWGHWFSQGDYMVFGTGQTYVLRGDWTYIGMYGSSAELPAGFPTLHLQSGYVIAIEHI